MKNSVQRELLENRLCGILFPSPYKKQSKKRKLMPPAIESNHSYLVEDDYDDRSRNYDISPHNNSYENEMEIIRRSTITFDDFGDVDARDEMDYRNIQEPTYHLPYPQVSILMWSCYLELDYVIDRRLGSFKYGMVTQGNEVEFTPLIKLDEHKTKVAYFPTSPGYHEIYVQATDGQKWKIFDIEFAKQSIKPPHVYHCKFELIGSVGFLNLRVDAEQCGCFSFEVHGTGVVQWDSPQTDPKGNSLFLFNLKAEGCYCVILRVNGEVHGIHHFIYGRPVQKDAPKVAQLTTNSFLARQFSFKPKVHGAYTGIQEFQYADCQNGLITILTTLPDDDEIGYVKFTHNDETVSECFHSFEDIRDPLVSLDYFIIKETVALNLEDIVNMSDELPPMENVNDNTNKPFLDK